LVGADLGEYDASEFAGEERDPQHLPEHRHAHVRQQRTPLQRARRRDGRTVVLCVSPDLPFAMSRFRGAEGIENVKVGSTFRSDFGSDHGVTLTDGKLQGVLAAL